MDESSILYQTPSGTYWVSAYPKGFRVWKSGATHATLAMTVGKGPGPKLGLERAIAEANKRESR